MIDTKISGVRTSHRSASSELIPYTNPRFTNVPKFTRFGKIVDIWFCGTPNQLASVVAYCTLPVVGTHRQFVPESSGPFNASVGNVPYICPPFTAPPITIWYDPHA